MNSAAVAIPPGHVEEFRKELGSDRFLRDERSYKDAVSRVMTVLLAPATIERTDFAALIGDVFRGPMPDLQALGLSAEDRAFVEAADLGPGRLRGAMANLSGGRWGLAQFYPWLPRAVERGLGEPVADAFRRLADAEVALPERVDRFRDDLYSVSQELERKGGYEPKWRLFKVSLSFVAMILGAVDPTRNTFYPAGAIQRASDAYLGPTAWPTGTAGERYERVCAFVAAVLDALKAEGLPVADLIDAESFIWLRFEKPAAPAQSSGPQPKAVAVGWPLQRALGSPRNWQDVCRQAVGSGPVGRRRGARSGRDASSGCATRRRSSRTSSSSWWSTRSTGRTSRVSSVSSSTASSTAGRRTRSAFRIRNTTPTSRRT